MVLHTVVVVATNFVLVRHSQLIVLVNAVRYLATPTVRHLVIRATHSRESRERWDHHR